MGRLRVCGILAILSARAVWAAAEPATESRLHWVTNGTVRAAAVHEQTLFIGGSFTRVAPAQNLLGPWFGVSTVTGAALPPLPITNGPVYAIEPDGAGGYFVGGLFTRIGAVPRRALARVLPDGRVDPEFDAPILSPYSNWRADVRSLARSGDVLYAGGALSLSDAPGSSGLVALDARSGAVRPWYPNVGPSIFPERIIVSESAVYVVGGAGLPEVWALDPVTARTQWTRSLVSGHVYDAAYTGTRLIVVGPFVASYGTSLLQGVVSLDPSTGVPDTAWGPAWPPAPTFPQLTSVSVVGSAVFVGGTFTELAGQPRTNAAALDVNTGALTSWAPQVDGTVRDIVPAAGGSVYLAGGFRHVGGQPRDALAQVDVAGSVTAWSAGAYSTYIRALQVVGDTLLAGGTTAVTGGVARENLAAFALDADDVRSWAPAMPHVVYDLAAHDGRLFAGLAQPNGSAPPSGHASVVAFDALNGLPLTWTPPPDGPWYLVGLVDGLVYLVSSAGFGSRFVRVDSRTGAIDPMWRVNIGPRISSIRPVGDLLYLAGDWFRVDGVTRSYLAAVDRRTGALTAWNQRVLRAPPEGVLTVGNVAITGQTMFLSSSTPFGTELVGIDIDTGLQVNPLFSAAVQSSILQAVADGWLIVTRSAPVTGDVEIRAIRNDGVFSSWNPNLSQVDPPDFAGFVPIRILTSETDVIVTNVKGGSGAAVHGIAVLPRQASSFPSALDAVTHDNIVRLTWIGAEPPPSSYVIEAGSEPGRSNIASFRTGTSATSLEALAEAGTYFVRVRSDNPGEAGPPSNEVALNVAGCSGAAAPPPTRFRAAMNGTTVTLAWEPSAGVVTNYVIEAGSRDGAANLARIAIPGDRTNFTTDAPPGTYFVRIHADTSCGPSASTPDIWLTVGGGTLPAAPSGLMVTGTVPIYTASWQSVDGVSYVLEAGSAPGLADLARIVTAENSVGPATVTPGATYYLRVRAIGEAGIGPPSEEYVLIAR